MKHLMLDFETLATTPDAAVLSLGACVFDNEKILAEHYTVFDLAAQLKTRRVDASTIGWWFDQGDAAKAVIKQAVASRKNTPEWGAEFVAWVSQNAEPSKVQVWSNGANFDVVIIEHLLSQLRLSPPWKFWNVRCYRTLKSLFPIETGVERGGVKHNALDDAKFQANCVIRHLSSQSDFT